LFFEFQTESGFLFSSVVEDIRIAVAFYFMNTTMSRGFGVSNKFSSFIKLINFIKLYKDAIL